MKKGKKSHDRLEVLGRCFLFRGIRQEEIGELLHGLGEEASFDQSAVIYDRAHYRRSLGVLLKGEAEAVKGSGPRRVVMNRFSPAMIFGAAAVFGGMDDYVTEISAAPRCTVLFLTDEDLTELFRRSFAVAQNYIVFLTQRIYFLNRKIDGFTLSSVEEKLALYLLDNLCPGTEGCGEVPLPCSLTELAQRLDISRASLYRGIDSLIQAGALERRGKTLLIRDEGLLKRNMKSKA
ncbi:MAG: Crp/Fnr family transcriptional regulator [Oscillospiraceae bacterium]|nr:Crp/Fnr family transcriptional regulator [Oscillospiraceae bacterium]